MLTRTGFIGAIIVIVRLSKIIVTTLLAVVLAVYLLTWLASPYVIKNLANNALQDLNFRLGDSSHARFNPFTFSLNLQDITLHSLDENEALAGFSSGTINVDSFALLNNTLQFDLIHFDDVQLELNRSPELLKISGFHIPLMTDTELENEPEPASTLDLSDWFVSITRIELSRVIADIEDHGQPHLIKLDNIALQNLVASLAKQQGHFSLAASINDALLTTNIRFDLSDSLGEINLEFALQHFNPGNFAYLAGDDIDALSAAVSLAFTQNLSLQRNGFSTELRDFSLQIAQLEAETQGLQFSNERLSATTNKFQLAMQHNEISALAGELALQLNDTKAVRSDTNDVVLALGSIDTEGAALELNTSGQAALTLSQLSFNSIKASELADASLAALFNTPKLSIKGINLHSQGIAIDAVQLAPFDSAIVLAEDKTLMNLVLPPATEEPANTGTTSPAKNTPPEAPAADPDAEQLSRQEPSESSFAIQLGRFDLSGESHIAVDDRSTSPPFSETISLQELHLGHIDNQAVSHATPYRARFKTDKYSNGLIEGEVKLFSEKLNLNIASQLTEFPLPQISTYVKAAAGIELLTGQFDNTTSMKIVDDELEGNSVLLMRGVDVAAADDETTDELTGQSFIPLNIALGTLKDSDGNIEIEVPLSGNIHDPDVGLNGFIALLAQKAALAASESYLINTFVPYANVVSLTKMAGSFALKVRIDDLSYQPGQTLVEESQQPFITALIALLEEKPELQIKVCPVATSDDLPGEGFTPEQQALELKTLAQTRGQVFKDHLIEHANIASARLLLCQPQIDNDPDTKPRIEFDI